MMKKQTKWIAALSTVTMMTALTPAFTMNVMAANTGWVEEDDSMRYYDSDGYYLTDSWKKQDSDWFYLDETGYIAFDQQIDEYYVGIDGKRVINQWVSVPNEDAWDDTEEEEFWLYYGKDGKYISSKFQSIDDHMYYFDSDGHMAVGLVEVDDATYYMEQGVMKTGWVQLVNIEDDFDEEEAWYYFNKNGKMVENQVDKKIDEDYYTFVEGKVVTGWHQVPVAEEAATASDAVAVPTQETVSGYQYYDKETGKRAFGWREVEGVLGISEEDEIYRFYFKNGKPMHAETGIQAFSINSAKYAFNTKGEMQTGLQVITLEDGSTANYLFGEDGAMKTGKQTVYDEDLDQNQTWLFRTDGNQRGQGFHGIRDNAIYENGLRKQAEDDLRYAPVMFQENQYLVNASGTIQKAANGSKSSTKPELGAGHKDVKDASDDVWVVDTNGIIH